MRRLAIPALTGLRGYAALLVVYAHVVSYEWAGVQSAFARSWFVAHLGMTLFFVLSGFVIHWNYRDRVAAGGGAGLRRFAVARFARLYPLYLAALAIYVAVLPAWPPDAPAVLLRYLTMSESWTPTRVSGVPLTDVIPGGLWSISTEIALYAAYVGLVRPLGMLRTPRRAALAAAVLTLLASAVWLVFVMTPLGADYTPWAFYVSPWCRLPEFTLGALAAQALMVRGARVPGSAERLAGTAILAASLGWIATVAALNYVPAMRGMIEPLQWSWGYAPGAAGLVYALARYRTPIAGFVERRVPLLIGEASYSLYLLHGLFLGVFGHAGAGERGFNVFRLATMLALMLLTALGSYSVLELPARRWLRARLTHPLPVLRSDDGAVQLSPE